MARREVALIACGARKLGLPAPAKHLYVGRLFRACRQWVEAQGMDWAVLSAEHGVVLPDRELAPYERHLNSMNADQRRAWGLRATHEAYCRFGAARFVVLAGRLYMSVLRLDVPIHDQGVRGEVVDVFARLRGEIYEAGSKPGVGALSSWLEQESADHGGEPVGGCVNTAAASYGEGGSAALSVHARSAGSPDSRRRAAVRLVTDSVGAGFQLQVAVGSKPFPKVILGPLILVEARTSADHEEDLSVAVDNSQRDRLTLRALDFVALALRVGVFGRPQVVSHFFRGVTDDLAEVGWLAGAPGDGSGGGSDGDGNQKLHAPDCIPEQEAA